MIEAGSGTDMTYIHQRDALATVFSGLGGVANLEGVLKWVPRVGLSLAGVDLVQQDEFSYDFLIPVPAGRWLAFGVT